MFHVPEQYRIKNHALFGTTSVDGNNGAFWIPNPSKRMRHNDRHSLNVIASDGAGWEHVSVSLRDRIPKWKEMHYIKTLFWDKEDTVIQYHPPQSQYVNCHPFTLHLWRPIGLTIPVPPSILVGPKT